MSEHASILDTVHSGTARAWLFLDIVASCLIAVQTVMGQTSLIASSLNGISRSGPYYFRQRTCRLALDGAVG